MGFEREASWLHPSSPLFGVIGSVRQFFIALVFVLFGAGASDYSSLTIAGVVVLVAVLQVLMRYVTFRYRLTDEVLLIDEGWIFRRHRTIPANRIQNVELIRNPLHHLFGVAEVRIETAGGSEPEARLRVLGMEEVGRLRDAIFRLRHAARESDVLDSNRTREDQIPQIPQFVSNVHSDMSCEKTRRETELQASSFVYRIPLSRLFLAGLFSNRGFVTVPIAFGLFQQLGLDESLDVEALQSQLHDQMSEVEKVLWITSAILILLVVLRMVSVVWYVFRFYGYQLERYGEDLRVKCGLMTQRSATIPRHRIQFISIQQSMLGRLFGLASIRIETAGGAGPKQGKETSAIAGRWFLPVVHDSEIPQIMEELREEWDYPYRNFGWGDLQWHGPHPKTFRRRIRAAGVLGVASGGIASLVWGGQAGVIVGGVVFVLLAVLLRWKARSLTYGRGTSTVYFRSGMVTRKLSMTFFEKIQNIEVLQSWFDRRWGMAALVVDTAAAGPAQHRIGPRYLAEAFAFSEYEQIASRIDQTPPALHGPCYFRSPVGIMHGDVVWREPVTGLK